MTPLAFAWLAAYRWGVGIAVGALLWLAIAHLAPIRWFAALRPVARGLAVGTVPVAIGWLPILAALPLLYPWVGGGPLAHGPPSGWLSEPAFLIRTLGVLLIWLGSLFAFFRRPWTGTLLALLLAAPAWSLFAFDAWMSLDPGWGSSIYGLLAFGSGMRDALAAIVLFAGLTDGRMDRPALPPDLWHALGRLQLTSILIWAYLMFAQLFIVWIAAEPSEIDYYLTRWSGPWRGISLSLIAGAATLSVLLLSRALKRDRRAMMAVAAAVLFGGVVDCWWTVLPHRGEPTLLDLIAALVMAAALAITALLDLRRSPVDPDTGDSLAYRSR